MEKKDDNPLARFERQKTNYPLIACAVILMGVLVAGAVVSAKASDLISAGIFIAALAFFVVVMLLDIAKTRRMAAVDDRRFIRWDTAMPEIQRQNVNVEVRELARLGSRHRPIARPAPPTSWRKTWHQADQQEENLPSCHVSVAGRPLTPSGREDLIIIEVAFRSCRMFVGTGSNRCLKRYRRPKRIWRNESRLRLRLMVVLVTQLHPTKEKAPRHARHARVLDTGRYRHQAADFEMLQKVYVSEYEG